MKIKHLVYGTVVGLAALVGVSMSTYTVNEKQQSYITRFGKPTSIVVGSKIPGQEDTARVENVKQWTLAKNVPVKHITSGAGLYFKIPIVDRVHYFDDRVLEYDAAPTDVVTKDKKHINMDNYARWYIKNPLLFSRTVGDEKGAQSRLDDIIYSVQREIVGQYNMIEVVRSSNEAISSSENRVMDSIYIGRESIMHDITVKCDEKCNELGIGIIDVRIKRADLPEENANAVYGRMKEERARIAKSYRSQGDEEAMKIRAETDKEKTILLTEAEKQAQQIRGEGDAQALKIYAQGYSKDPKFYEYWRTLESYRTAYGSGNTKMVIVDTLPYNKYFNGKK